MRARSPKTPGGGGIRALLEEEHLESVEREASGRGRRPRCVLLEAVPHQHEGAHRRARRFPFRVLDDAHDLRASAEAVHAQHGGEQGVGRGVPARVVEVPDAPEIHELHGQVAGVPGGAEQFRMQRTGQIPGGRPARRGVHREDQALHPSRYRGTRVPGVGEEAIDRAPPRAGRGDFFRRFFRQEAHEGRTARQNGPIMPMTDRSWKLSIWKKPTR